MVDACCCRPRSGRWPPPAWPSAWTRCTARPRRCSTGSPPRSCTPRATTSGPTATGSPIPRPRRRTRSTASPCCAGGQPRRPRILDPTRWPAAPGPASAQRSAVRASVAWPSPAAPPPSVHRPVETVRGSRVSQHTIPTALGPARRLDAEAALDHIPSALTPPESGGSLVRSASRRPAAPGGGRTAHHPVIAPCSSALAGGGVRAAQLRAGTPRLSSRWRTRRSIPSRMGRTASTPWPAGSSRVQSS